MARDYYAILGVSKDATPEQIRRLHATAHDLYLRRPMSAWLRPVSVVEPVDEVAA